MSSANNGYATRQGNTITHILVHEVESASVVVIYERDGISSTARMLLSAFLDQAEAELAKREALFTIEAGKVKA